MAKEDKVQKTVYLEIPIAKHINDNPHIKNLNAWINERYPEEFMNVEQEIKRKEMLVKDLAECEVRIKNLQEVRDNIPISDMAKVWLKEEGPQRITRFSFDSVLRCFNDKFDLSLSANQFRILVAKYKKD